MRKLRPNRSVLVLVVLLFGLSTLAAAQEVAKVEVAGDAIVFHPVVEFAELHLTVTGPCNFEYKQRVRKGELFFRLDETTIDGMYRYNLFVVPEIDGGILEILKAAREKNDNSQVDQLCRDGKLPGDPLTQSDGFLVRRGRILWQPGTVEKGGGARVATRDGFSAAAGSDLSQVELAPRDFVINDDLIVDGSACIGFDCVNGESFGFDTVRLKENNLRIKFDDTSVAASFPRNDWQLTANDSANGGASKFSIDDISGNRTPFTIEANARSHSLYVDDGGRIGSRTSTPSTEIHTIDGDTPTLRLQQDGSSGFAPQTWDVAGNETNFFIRDVTNGSTLPFRIRPGAPSSAIFIDVDGDVGLGTASPEGAFHIENSGSDEDDFTVGSNGQLTVSSTASPVFAVQRQGTTRFVLEDVTAGATWQLGNEANGDEFRISKDGTGNVELALDSSGNLTVNGTVTPMSSRASKTNFGSVDALEILDLALGLPIGTWSYKTDDPSVRHLGPVAEDFRDSFGLGKDSGGIATTDLSGVALVSIQALHQTVTEKIREKDEQIDSLASRVAELEAMIESLAQASQ